MTSDYRKHRRYVRFAIRQRNAHAKSYSNTLLAFGLFVVIFVLIGIGAGLLWMVNR